jgi:1,4-alpha-glucan branching enzyme
MPGDDWQKFANLRALYGYMYGHPGKKLLFMGAELGQTREWTHDTSLDWHLLGLGPYHSALQRFVKDLNHVYRNEPALHQRDFEAGGFEWIDLTDADSSVLSFLRRGKNASDFVIVSCNFTPIPRPGYRVGVPHEGFYRELLNTDSPIYGGSGFGKPAGTWTDPIPWHGRPASVVLDLPPLGVVYLKPATG